MPVDDSLLELMQEEYDWKRRTGQDRWQKPTWSDGEPVRGYHVEEDHQVTTAEGVKRPAKGTIYLADVYGVTTEDELWLDGVRMGDLLKVVNYRDENGPYGSEVHYG